MYQNLIKFILRNEIQLVLLVVQVTFYWISVLYAPESKEGVAYQRF